jgi:hypothetical protein
VALGALLFLAATAVFAWFAWEETAEAFSAMSGHGIFAAVLGLFFTIVVGGGLMALVFYSSRKGHDDDAGTGF